MTRAHILGLGSYVPDRVVTNDELPYLNTRHEVCAEKQMDTNDAWIQQRTGIRERRYAPEGVGTSDLAVEATRAALADAGATAADIDCFIFATLSPDIHFPGSAVFLQNKLGVTARSAACYDIRQQCSGFIYGMQMADAFVRTGIYQRVLLVGAEVHSHSLDYTTRGRDVGVLFGDGAGAVLIGPGDDRDPRAGITYTDVHADGTGIWDLYAKVFEIKKMPYVDYNALDRSQNESIFPHMEGKRVYLQAVRGMVLATKKALDDTGLTWNDIDWYVPHQANLRINQKVVEVGEIPPEKVLNSIEHYGNTTAATVPLTIDHWRKQGKVEKGDRMLSVVFGAGYTWGAAIFTL